MTAVQELKVGDCKSDGTDFNQNRLEFRGFERKYADGYGTQAEDPPFSGS